MKLFLSFIIYYYLLLLFYYYFIYLINFWWDENQSVEQCKGYDIQTIHEIHLCMKRRHSDIDLDLRDASAYANLCQQVCTHSLALAGEPGSVWANYTPVDSPHAL